MKVIDLSARGHQPMTLDEGRAVVTFNGEIYNYLELRRTLESVGESFCSESDTEVLLRALSVWDVGALARLEGMFSFAFWNEKHHRLLLARDRLGIKPLYFAVRDGQLAFGSEIRAILASGLVTPCLDTTNLESYLRLLWVPEPRTLFRGIHKLEPGAFLEWDGREVRITRYWDIPEPSSDGAPSPEELHDAVLGAVTRQLQSDVPVGAFLSGGLDSTAIVAMCRKAGVEKLQTYSIGFESRDRSTEGAYDDLSFARLAAKAFRTDHREIILNPDVTSLLPRVVRHLEDPVADPAAINCLLICEAARGTSTVLLAGTGGDELFGGYRKYASTVLASNYQRIPLWLRRMAVEPLVRRLPIRIGSKGIRSFRFAKKLVRYAGESLFDRFVGYSSYYDGPELEELLGGDPTGPVDPYLGVEALRTAWESRVTSDVIDRMTYVDMKYYLPGLNLAYMDKASMAASVEVRVPLLDESLVQLGSRIPGNLKVSGTRTKIALREAMRGHVPEAIIDRPKAPFAAPIRSWIGGELSDYVHDLLSPSRVLQRGLLNPAVVHRILKEHESGAEDHSLRIWALLTLEVWISEFCDDHSWTEEHALAADTILTTEPVVSA